MGRLMRWMALVGIFASSVALAQHDVVRPSLQVLSNGYAAKRRLKLNLIGVAGSSATGSITASAKSNYTNNDHFALSDGTHTAKTFEYKVTGGFAATAGRIVIDISAVSTAAQVSAAALTVIRAQHSATFIVSAVAGTSTRIDLTNDLHLASGNVSITATDPGDTIVGMSGGVNSTCVDNTSTTATDCTLGGGGTGNFSFSGNTESTTTSASPLTITSGQSDNTQYAFVLKSPIDYRQGAGGLGLVDFVAHWSGVDKDVLYLAVGNDGGVQFCSNQVNFCFNFDARGFLVAADNFTTVNASLGHTANDGVTAPLGWLGMILKRTTVGSRRTCDASNVGTMWLSGAGAGETDTISVCLKSAADTYSWKDVVNGG